MQRADPLGPQPHLRGGLLTGDHQRRPVHRGHPVRHLEQQRRLAHAGLPTDEDERRGHESAAEDAVELVHPGRDPFRFFGGDVDEPQERLRRRLRACATRLRYRLLEERPERGATGALPEPAPGGVAALGARVLDSGLRHVLTLRSKADEFVTTTKKRPPPQGAAFVSPEEIRAPAASGPRSC